MNRQICLLLLCWSFVATATPLQVVTEHLPPMQIVENDKVVGGMATELVQALLKQTGETAQIQPYNWARAYKIALEQENVMIFSMSRYPSREKQFKWVGQIYSLSNHLWRLTSRKDIKINTIEDAKKYMTVAIRQDVQHEHLKRQGFKLQQHLILASNLGQALELLFRGRVDLFVASDTFMPEYIKLTDYSMADLEPIIRISNTVDSLHIAFSRQTDDKQVERFRQALKQLKEDGSYDRIISKWENKIGINP